jgi:pimeloyl-ACP methyl ester carboxylesterase
LNNLKKVFIKIACCIFLLYISICVCLYFFQEKILFFPEHLAADFKYNFKNNFEEKTIPISGGTQLSALLFKSVNSKGVIFYLHGNGGSLRRWGDVAGFYTQLNYDVFMIDYRGYGKSWGNISGMLDFYNDIHIAYDYLKKSYAENKIIVLGYSIGTGPATEVASSNHPRLLILQAPYYSLKDLMHHTYKIIPDFILRYDFSVADYLQKCPMPVVIFHGSKDEVIYYGSSLKLKSLFKSNDTLITLDDQLHNGITDNAQYRTSMKKILE